MPIPALDECGLLPAGIHDCALGEIAARFGVFQGNEQRPRLIAKLEALVAEAQASGIVLALIVDGSFVTDKRDPGDIDLAVVLPVEIGEDADLLPMQYNLVSKRSVRRRFGFDIVVAGEKTSEYKEAVAFFQQVRGQPAMRKGILRISL